MVAERGFAVQADAPVAGPAVQANAGPAVQAKAGPAVQAKAPAARFVGFASCGRSRLGWWANRDEAIIRSGQVGAPCSVTPAVRRNRRAGWASYNRGNLFTYMTGRLNAPSQYRLRLLLMLAFIFATAGICVRGDAQTSVEARHLKVTLVSDQASIDANSSHTAVPPHVGLLFDLEPGWHVYWSNAGDSGEPPSAKWTLPAGVTVGPLQFPAPKRLPLGPLMDFGYETEVLFPAELHIHTDNANTVPIATDVSWLVCRQACIPGKAHLGIALPMGDGSASAAAPLFTKTFAAMPKVLPARAKAIFTHVPGGFQLAVLTGTRVEGAQFFPADQSVIANAAPQPVTPRGDGAVIGLKQDENLTSTPRTLSGIVVLADGTSYMVRAGQGTIPPPPLSVSESAGALRYVGFALIGGVLLNLMPCVFPVLFIKALALVQSSTSARRAMRVQGLAYTLGILVSFWIVVGVLLALRAGGKQLGWGFQFQSPVFVAMIALLLFFLALSLAGMFEIGLSVTSAGSSLANKHGLAGSFFTGVLAMVVATPCAAPFLGAAIGFALVQSAAVAFAVFTALGVGLALPYLLLAFQPAWTRLLPKPGVWMELLKQATAVPIFATVIWLVWVFAQLAGATALIGLLTAFLLLGIAGWVLGRWPARLPATVTAVAILVLAIAAPSVCGEDLPGARERGCWRERRSCGSDARLAAVYRRCSRAIPGAGAAGVCGLYRGLVFELPGE